MHNQQNIESFLKLGYFLDFKNKTYSFDYSGINKQKYEECSESELINIGSSLFMKAIEKEFKKSKLHVVPLSGGLDSRAVLGALLQFTDPSNIHTYTYGTPGTLDYDIGNKLAKSIGTKHIKLPLTDYNYKMDELLDVSKRIQHQTVLFHHPPINKIDNLFKNASIWSGFFGDALTGGHYNSRNPVELISAKQLFIRQNTYQHNVDMQPRQDTNFSNLIDTDVKLDNLVSTTDLLDFNNRQLKFIAPHVLIQGFNYKTPFINQDLFNFYLSIGNIYRENQSLYKKILLQTFPELFSYPVKNNAGLKLNSSQSKIFIKRSINKIKSKFIKTNLNKQINYLEFDTSIREKKDLKEIIRENVYDLNKRQIIDWLDINQIYEEHIKGNKSYGKALLLLASLEIHMKAKE